MSTKRAIRFDDSGSFVDENTGQTYGQLFGNSCYYLFLVVKGSA